MKSISKIMLSFLIGITTLSSCKPKTPHEQFLLSMEGKSDSELVQEMYGEIQTYKVYNIQATREDDPYKDVEVIRPKVKVGAVLNITFSDHSIFIEGFDNLNGSYQSGYYASTSGEFTAEFTKPQGGGINGAIVNNGERKHPKEKSKSIKLVQTATTRDGFSEFNIEVTYSLHRL